MKKILAMVVSLVTVVFLLAGCTGAAFDPSTAYKGQTAKQLYDNGVSQMKQAYYQDATQYFRTLEARYPYSEYTPSAQLDIIYAYYMNDDDPSALLAADNFIHLYPTDPHVDYAYYMKAMVNFDSSVGLLERHLPVDLATRDLTAAKQSFIEYTDLVHRFPDSRYVPDALKRMTYIRNLLAMHELEVAKFYVEHGAYIAAVDRTQMIVLHYQEASVMPDALLILYQSYNKLGLTEQADKVAQIYNANYKSAKPLSL